jgi:hypothetical protein
MTAQLKHVALTYLTRRSLWLVAGFTLLAIAPTLLAGGLNPDYRRNAAAIAMFPLGFGSGVLAWILVTQAKWQFCDSRARLLPGFARAHLAVLAGLILLGYGVYPPLSASVCRWNPLGVAACMAGVGASYLWTMHSMQWLPGLLTMVMFLSLMTKPGLEFWVLEENAGQFALAHVAILVVGWTGFVAWLARLTRVREEDSDYLIPVQAQQGSATRMERTQAARTLARQVTQGRILAVASDRWLDPLQRVKATTTAARQWLLRFGYGPVPVGLTALWIALSFAVMIALMTRYQFGSRGAEREILPALPMLILMPSFMVGGMFVMRRARLGSEIFLPLSRRQFVNGLLLTGAWNSLQMWVVTHAAVLGLVYWAEPATLTPKFGAEITALSIAVQLSSFAVSAWMSRLQSAGVRMIGTIVALIPIMTVLGFGMNALPRNPPRQPPDPGIAMLQQALVDGEFTPEDRAKVESQIAEMRTRQYRRQRAIREKASDARVAWVTGTLAVVGLGLIVDQRRRWLNTELG